MSGAILLPTPTIEMAPVASPMPEAVLPQTAAERLGLVDGQVIGRRGKGETATFESGYSILETGYAVDKNTGQSREEVIITKPKLDADGKQVIDEEGLPVDDFKQYWLDDLMAMQSNSNLDAADSSSRLIKEVENGGAEEAEGASPEEVALGGTMLSQAVEVDTASIPADEIQPQPVETNDALPTVEKQMSSEESLRYNRKINEVINMLDSTERMSGVEANNTISNLQNLGNNAEGALKDIYNGLIIGALRDPSAVKNQYENIIRKRFEIALTDNKPLLADLDAVVDSRISFLRNVPPEGFESAMGARLQRVKALDERLEVLKTQPGNATPQAESALRFLGAILTGMAPQSRRGEIAHRRLLSKPAK